MTDRTTEEAKREAFEAHMKADWGGDPGWNWRNPDGSYVYTESEWLAFQAALQWQAEQQNGEALPKIASEVRIMLGSATELFDGIGDIVGYQIKTGALHRILGLLSGAGHPVAIAAKNQSVALAASPHGVPPQPSSIQQRAIYLHEKAAMPWPDAEELALNEAGIDARAIDELIGECGYAGLASMLCTDDELRRFTRSVLVHQPASSLPQAPQGEQTHTLVPDSALRWLFGEEGEFECPPEKYFRGKPPGYWWRSVFREKAGLSAPPPLAQGDSNGV